MWKFLKAVGKGIFYVVFSPMILFLWAMDRVINGKPGGQDKILGQQLPPGVKYFSSSGTFSVVDVGAYFGSIAASRREDLIRASKKMEEEKRIANEQRMRAERVQALTVDVEDASASIKTSEDLVRYFRNVPEGTRQKVLFESKKKDDPS